MRWVVIALQELAQVLGGGVFGHFPYLPESIFTIGFRILLVCALLTSDLAMFEATDGLKV